MTNATIRERVCFVLNNIGDYHAARLHHLEKTLADQGYSLVVIEASSTSAFYGHKQKRAAKLVSSLEIIRLSNANEHWHIIALWKKLYGIAPKWIFTIGYSDSLSIATLVFGKANRVPVFFMADSKADDQPRRRVTEIFKSVLLRRFSGALVAGDRHRDYFRAIGMKTRIEIGYDVIDNTFFKKRANELSRKIGLLRRLKVMPDRYILCVSRLVDRKRLDLVIRIYKESGASEHGVRLMIIGDGAGKAAMWRSAEQEGIVGQLCHLNNVPNSLMPIFHACADALLLASDYDQWGLSVNEAMAVGTPAIVTHRCGVANEIVLDGCTGFVVPAGASDAAARVLRRLVEDKALRQGMGEKAARMMDDWDLDRFAAGVLKLMQDRV